MFQKPVPIFGIKNERESKNSPINFLLKPFLSFVIFLSFFFLVHSSVYAATYYVDPDITDTHPASATPDFTTYNHLTFATDTGSDSVYKTIADVNLKSFAAGDSILFKKGGTWTNEKLALASSGTVLSPITIGAYGSGTNPTLNGTNNSSGGGNGISVFSRSNVIVQDFIIYNYAQGVQTGANTNVTIQRVTIHDCYYSGVAFSWGGNSSTVKDSELYSITYNGIALDGSGANNTGNTFSNLNIHNNYTGIKIQFSTGNTVFFKRKWTHFNNENEPS